MDSFRSGRGHGGGSLAVSWSVATHQMPALARIDPWLAGLGEPASVDLKGEWFDAASSE